MVHLAETSEDLAETTKTKEIWRMADTYQGELGRRPTLIITNAQTKVSKVNPSLRIR